MAYKLLKYTWQKVTLSVLLVLAAVILIAAFLLNYYFSPILGGKLKSTVLKASDSLYHVDFDNAKLDILQGKIVVYNISLNPDTAVYTRLKKLNTAPEQLYRLKVKELVLNHVHPFKIFFKHEVDVAELMLDAPAINVALHPNPQKNKKPKDDRTIYQRISNSLKMLHVGTIRLSNIKLKYENYSTAQPAVSEFKDLDLGADNLLIDSATQFDKSRFLYCREVTLSLKNYSGRSAGELYGYKAKLVKFSTLTHQLTVRQLAVRPLQSPAGFFEKTYGDRFIINASLIKFNHFDFDIVDKSHTIKASSLLMSGGSIGVFSNPRTNPKSFFTDKSITFPNRAIHTIPIGVKIDTVKVRNYAVRYEEYNKKSKQTGFITFNQINGHLYNVTNDSASLRKNQLCHVKLSTLFMGRAPTNLQFTFHLADSSYAYSYAGAMGPVNLQAINVATMPLASIKMQSGRVNRFSFAVQGNRHMSKGTVTLLYNDLKIQLLNADSSKLKGLHLALASLLANALIIKNNNPDHAGEAPRVANVVYLRPINYPFFETLWRTLMMGIKKSAGLDAKTQQDADIKQAQKQKEEFLKKDSKQDRKKQRQEKRRLKKLAKAQKKARKKAEKERRKAEKEARNQ